MSTPSKTTKNIRLQHTARLSAGPEILLLDSNLALILGSPVAEIVLLASLITCRRLMAFVRLCLSAPDRKFTDRFSSNP